MSLLYGFGGFLVFLSWIALFGGGIMIDTAPYRKAISPEGEEKLRTEGQPATAVAEPARPPGAPPAAGAASDRLSAASTAATAAPAATTDATRARAPDLVTSWLVVLFCFLPLNLAWLCVSASTLGAIGNLANLSDDDDARQPRDTSNPLLSAILRGFFVYLFLMSGLLLLDHAPFSNAGPNHYIRLAGFLSLFSFVVSYHPHLFGTLIVSAFERLQVRAGDQNGGASAAVQQQHTSLTSVEIESTSTSRPVEDTVAGRR